MRLRVLGSITVLFAIGCGDVATPEGGGGAGQGGQSAGGGGSGGAIGESYSVTFDPITVEPGMEDTQCVVRKLPNPNALHVGTIHNQLGPGSHHLIVYRTNDTEEQTTPFPCQPFADLLDPAKGTPLMISQKQDDTLTLPPGVAFSVAQEQFVRLEMHFINATTEPLEVTATSTFIAMDDADFENEADFLFFGNPDIDIAAMSAATLGPTYLPLPDNLAGSKFFGFAGHTHQWGTNVTVAATPGADGPDTMVYDVQDWQWAEPETVYLDPPIELPDGGGFHLTCDWQNSGSSAVGFGESANDEMCFFWTYYYPSKGAFVCAHTDQFGSIDLCCPGNALCNQLF